MAPISPPISDTQTNNLSCDSGVTVVGQWCVVCGVTSSESFIQASEATNKKNTPKHNNAHLGPKDRVILFLISGSMMGDFVWVGGGW